jgi:hypothetical protein
MAKYGELARQIFRTAAGGTTILLGNEAIISGANVSSPRRKGR